MKQPIITAVLLLFTFSIFGQESTKPVTSKLRIGIGFSPNYCYRILKATNGQTQTGVELRNETELPKFGYSTGISLIYDLNQTTSLESGILFSDRGEKTKGIDVVNYDQSNEPIGKAYFNYHYQYLDIPVKLNHFITRGLLMVNVFAGVSANVLLNEFSEIRVEYLNGENNEETHHTSNLTFVNLQLMAGIGLEFTVSKKITSRFEPVFRRSITSITEAPIKQYPYSFGMNLAIFYRF